MSVLDPSAFPVETALVSFQRIVPQHVSVWAIAAVISVASTTGAAATTQSSDPVQDAISRTRHDRDIERKTDLLRLWGLWGHEDPLTVHQALYAFSKDRSFGSGPRAYAGLLYAYGLKRLGNFKAAKEKIAALGFVSDWLVVGPFDNEGRGGLKQVYGPELHLHQPLDLGRSLQGKERPVRWRRLPSGAFPYVALPLASVIRPTKHVCAYATTFVRDARSHSRDASLLVGATGAYKMFFNGEEVLSDDVYREISADREATTVRLQPGWNRVTIKVCGDSEAPSLSLRVADARGQPDPRLQVSSDPVHGADAAKHAKAPVALPETKGKVVVRVRGKKGKIERALVPPKRKRDPGRVRGPIQVFEKLVGRKKPSPRDLEAYARHLYISGGDDPTKHLARDLASRAVDAKPTVARLLLASKLAADRNQQRAWLNQAEKLSKGHPNVKLVLARARLARTGPNWRDAISFYRKARQLDSNNIEALMGLVDLNNEAGLQRTALKMLEQEVTRHPRSVRLLRAYAAQLITLGRSAEANEVRERYTAYRADDAGIQNLKIQLAVARRDSSMLEHWAGRLLATHGASLEYRRVVARAWVRMGQPDKAIEIYKHVLELAPEDTATMRELANLHGTLGHKQAQIALLHRVLLLRPQFKSVREYLEHLEPARARLDESYAWAPERFLSLRSQPAGGYQRRVLRDLLVTTVYPNGLASRFHQVVYQPLTDQAAAAGRQYGFTYQADRQVVQMRAAKVYHANGQVDEAVDNAEGAVDDPSIAMYTSARAHYVTFPRLRSGDVVEVQYRVEDVTQVNAFADYFGEVNYMQSRRPTDNAEYVLIAPTSRKLYIDHFGLPGLKSSRRTKGDRTIYSFFAPKLQAVLPEPKMPPWSEVLGHVHVSTYRTWNDVGRWYWGLAKDQLTPDDEMRAKVKELTEGLKTDDEKVRAIYDYVVQKTRYVALEFGIYGYKPHQVSRTFSRGWGDCKDKAALMVSMLGIAGIPANMVIVRSSARGQFSSDLASLAPFDHAIAYVPSMNLYLDGTAEYTGSRELPAFDRTAMGLLVSSKGAKLVHLPNPAASETKRVRHLTATVRADGSAKLHMSYKATGAIAASWRRHYHDKSTRRNRLQQDIAQAFPGFSLGKSDRNLQTNDMENIETPVTVTLDGTAPGFASRQGKELFIQVTPNDRLVRRFASRSHRLLDIRMGYASTLNETWDVILPPGKRIQRAPTNTAFASPFGSFSMTVDRSRPGHVVVHTQMVLSKTRIKPAEYKAFRAFCERVDQALDGRVVVK